MAMKWYVKRNQGAPAGPFSSAQIRQLVQQGKIKPNTSLCLEDNGVPNQRWVFAGKVKGLFAPATATDAEGDAEERSVLTKPPVVIGIAVGLVLFAVGAVIFAIVMTRDESAPSAIAQGTANSQSQSAPAGSTTGSQKSGATNTSSPTQAKPSPPKQQKTATDYIRKAKENDNRLMAFVLTKQAEGLTRNQAIDAMLDKGYMKFTKPIMEAARDRNNTSLQVFKDLIRRGEDVNWKDSDDETVIATAASRITNPDIIQLLIDKGAEINPDKYSKLAPPLLNAISNKNSSVVKVFLDAGAAQHDEALLRAASLNNKGAVAMLLKAGADVNARDGESGECPLHDAHKNIDILQMLLTAGANVNARDQYGKTAIMTALNSKYMKSKKLADGTREESYYQPADLGVFKLLVDAGIKINAKDKYGRTALNLAAEKCRSEEVVKFLIESGGDVNLQDNDGKSALDFVANNPNPAIGSLLLSSGANIQAKNEKGQTPLMFLAASATDPSLVEQVIKSGADVNSHDNPGVYQKHHHYDHKGNRGSDYQLVKEGGWTPLMYAAFYNDDVRIVDSLLKAGADVNHRDSDGETVLMHAIVASDNPKLIKRLIDAGADVNAVCPKANQAPVHYAAAANQTPEVMKVLVTNGANPNALITRDCDKLLDYRKKYGYSRNAIPQDRSPLMIAAQYNGNEKVILILLNNGANAKYKDPKGRTVLDMFTSSGKKTKAYFELREAVKYD